jgi:UDP-N-acetylenolpyruvoylglucosamine reductase
VATQDSEAKQSATAATAVEKPTLEQLQAGLRGQLIQPGDPDYDEARKVYNAMIDKRPRYIVRCVDVADVISAVNFARENALTVSIRGGAHNVVGFATNDDGLVIDHSRMKGIRVDPETRTVRAEGGVTWGDLDHATHGFGFAVPGGIVSTTGITGLTLGGGVGNLTRSFGLSSDNLISADVVLADGRFVTANATKNKDLFWGLRGGGGNFGVVTSFEFTAHPVKMVLGGPIFYPIEKARDLMRFYRDFVAQAPADLNVYFGLHKAPPAPFVPEHLHYVNVAMLFVNYIGPMERAEEVMRPIRQFGPPALDLCGPVPFPAIQIMFDALLPPGLQHYWKAHFVKQLSDEAIEAHVTYAATIPNFLSGMHLYPSTGPGQHLANDESAWSYRDAQFIANIIGVGDDPAGNAERIRWVREYWEALQPYSEAGTYVNFLGDEGEERIRDTYRGNYDRLVALKTKYDPTNLFHMNQNIKPSQQ